jgi:hypothetical protein
MVRARSAAEMPVVTPSFASIDTVKAVLHASPCCGGDIGSQAELSRRDAWVNARQISPRPYMAMKLIGVLGSPSAPGMTRSPSFSRSSSSTRMIHAPVARLVDDLFDGGKDRTVGVGLKKSIKLGEGLGSGVPRVLGTIAQGVGVEPRGAGKTGAGHCVGCDEIANACDGGCAHASQISHCDVIASRRGLSLLTSHLRN